MPFEPSVKLFQVSNNTFMGIIVGGSLGLAFTGSQMRRYTQKKIQKATMYQEALKCALEHPQTKLALGEKIEEGYMDFTDLSKCGVKGNMNYFTIPLKGSKSNGEITYWVSDVSETDPEQKYHLSRVELRVQKFKNKMLMVKNDPLPGDQLPSYS